MPGVDENTPAVEPKKRKAQEEEFVSLIMRLLRSKCSLTLF